MFSIFYISFNAIIEHSLEDLEFVEQILSSDFLKMTDAERIVLVKWSPALAAGALAVTALMLPASLSVLATRSPRGH